VPLLICLKGTVGEAKGGNTVLLIRIRKQLFHGGGSVGFIVVMVMICYSYS
jgi:hypothetical protein